MADRDETETIWRRLTRLFRSGPVVRHKIASGEKLYEPKGTAKAYKRELSSLYVNSLASYGQYERLARYCIDLAFCVCVPGKERAISLHELIRRYPNGERFIVYAYDHEKKKIVPAWAHHPSSSGVKETVRVTLDDGSSFVCTPDHLCMMRDGSYRQAQELASGDSLMPFYRRQFGGMAKDGKKFDGYRSIYTMEVQPKSWKGWEPEHRLVAEWAAGRDVKRFEEHVHHRDHDPENNDPSNLEIVDARAHLSEHGKQAREQWADPEKRARIQSAIQRKWDADDGSRRAMVAKSNREKKSKDVTFEQVFDAFVMYRGDQHSILKELSCSRTVIFNRFRWAGHDVGMTWKNCVDTVESISYNHKVVSVEPNGLREVGDIIVDSYHNLALATENGQELVFVHNSDYVEMQFTPEIHSGLDIYADEVTCADEYGKVLNITSKDAGVKEILETLFFDVLNIEFNAWSWVRNLTQNGDFILFCDASEDNGILNLLPIPINEIEREEGFDKDDPFAVRYRWLTQGNMILQNWQVIHFRLLGNDAFLPYGCSVIEPARRIWRQLILIEDAMLVYRIVRSPERRVFKIDVGNIPHEEIDRFMEEVKTKMKRNTIVDNTTGRVDLRYNALPVRRDTKVPLLDGRCLTIEELAVEQQAGHENWVYSIQDGTRRVVPGRVIWCGKNYTCSDLHRVWLDDGTYVDAAPEHPFVLRDGTSRRADRLEPGDSLMPFVMRLSTKEDGRIIGYPLVYDPALGKSVFVHRIVAEDVLSEEKIEASSKLKTKNLVIHHVDFDSENAHPNNLRWMGNEEHWKYHASIGADNFTRYNRSPEKRKRISEQNRLYKKAERMGAAYNGSELHRSHNANRRVGQQKSWAVDRQKRSEGMRWVIPNEVMGIVFDRVKSEPAIKRKDLWSFVSSNDEIRRLVIAANSQGGRDVSRFHCAAIQSKLMRMGEVSSTSFVEFRDYAATQPVPLNHSVSRVERLADVDDVYCMTVVGPKGEEDRHNFAVQTSIDQYKNRSGCILVNSVDEDFFIPTRGDKGASIETLPGGQFTGDVEDVQYIQSKLFAALKIPKSYLGYEADIGSKCLLGLTNIALLDGRDLPIERVVEEFIDGKTNWVYSARPDGTMVPTKIRLAQKTKEVAEFVRVTLDDGGRIDCTDNHPFMMRDGTYRRADELSSGDRLMPIRRQLSSRANGDTIEGYEKILNNATGEWEPTHHVVDRELQLSHSIERSRVIHHVDCDKRNNSPDNLQEKTWLDHRRWHQKNARLTLGTPEARAKAAPKLAVWRSSERAREMWREIGRKTSAPGTKFYEMIHSPEFSGMMSDVMQKNWEDPAYRKRKSEQNKEIWERQDVRDRLSGDNHWVRRRNAGYDIEWLVEYCRARGISRMDRFFESSPPIGKRWLTKILKSSEYGRWRDLAKQRLVDTNHKVVSVDRIRLDSSVPVYDIEVDSEYHNFALSVGIYCHNSTLAQEDVRFAKTIERIQKIFIAELNKIAIIHLFLLGYQGDELVNFKIEMANPSTVSQQQRLELWRMRFEVAGMAQENVFDRETMYRRIFNLNDEEISKIKEGKRLDKLEDLALEQVGQDAAGTAAGGEEGGGPALGGEGENAPGAGELPDTLGGPPPAPEMLTLAGQILGESDDEAEDDTSSATDEVRNPGSEGDDAILAVDKGRNLFSTGDDAHELVFGTEKQTADDPFDTRSLRRMVTRPFSELADDDGDADLIVEDDRHVVVESKEERAERIQRMFDTKVRGS